jgi:catechol-2,3-dioxygenase
MAFFSFGDERDHDIAVIQVPEEQPVGSGPGLAHIALEIDGGEEELRELYNRLKSYGAPVELTADHVMSKSFYILDPDGNCIELFAQVLTSADGKKAFREAGSAYELLKPLDLETAAPAR